MQKLNKLREVTTIFTKNDFNEIKSIIESKEGIGMEFSDIPKSPKFSLYPSDGSRRPNIEFRVNENEFVLTDLYLITDNKDIGTEIFQWIKDFCIKNNLLHFYVKTVAEDKIAMHKLCKRFKMQPYKDLYGYHYKLEIR